MKNFEALTRADVRNLQPRPGSGLLIRTPDSFHLSFIDSAGLPHVLRLNTTTQPAALWAAAALLDCHTSAIRLPHT